MIGQRADHALVAFSVKVYRALLVAYPATFRQEYGLAMSQVFRDRCLQAFRQGGTHGILRLWVVTLLDLIQSVIAEHRQKAVEMKTEDVQLAGSALMGVAVIFIFAELLMAVDGHTFGGIYIGLINCLGIPLLVVGLLTMRNRYGEKVGVFGKNILLLGSILAPILSLIGFIKSVCEDRFLLLLFFIAPAVLFASLAMFGVVALYKKPFPYWNGAPIVAGVCYPILALPFIITSTITGDWERGLGTTVPFIASIIQGVGLVALGYVLKSDVPELPAIPA